MEIKRLTRKWFEIWDKGNFRDIPVHDDFQHSSPYGTVSGKATYLELVESNRDKFLGNQFIFHDQIFEGERACIRYTMQSFAFSMEVSEWIYSREGLISKIVSYYNIDGELSHDRKLSRI